MEVIDNIYQHSDKHKISIRIYLDLKKAFDTINPSILLKKLDIYGVYGTALKWFTCYLSNRHQYTYITVY